MEMDLEEWELLPDEGFVEINDDGGKNNYSHKYPNKDSSSVFQMNNNYFICPPKSIDLQPQQDQDRYPVEITTGSPPAASEKIKSFNQDHPAVFFKKMKETDQFVDMKVDAPKPQFDHSEKSEKMELDHGDGDEGIWKWSLTGIAAAICSFATFCIISFNSSQRRKKKHPQQQHNQNKLHDEFQIYSTNDKRMKQVVYHAIKINEAISAVRVVPITRSAHITFGGYYDA